MFAQDDFEPFLGADFFPWMVLAFGAAMVIGNVLALVRPPSSPGGPRRGSASESKGADEARRDRPPIARSVVMMIIGLAASVWGVASLLN